MLRITFQTANRSGSFGLEGRLTGLWAKELLRVAREISQNYASIFDLQVVSYIDSAGGQASRLLGECGTRFITDSAYGKDLCDRLKLSRIAVAKSECDRGHRPQDPLNRRNIQISDFARVDGLTAGQQRQREGSGFRGPGDQPVHRSRFFRAFRIVPASLRALLPIAILIVLHQPGLAQNAIQAEGTRAPLVSGAQLNAARQVLPQLTGSTLEAKAAANAGTSVDTAAGTITGTVLDVNGDLIPGATVVLKVMLGRRSTRSNRR